MPLKVHAETVVIHVIIIVSIAATGQVRVHVQLTSSIETQVCPGEVVEFTCTVENDAQLEWNIPLDRAIIFLPSHLPGRIVNRGGVMANLTSVQKLPQNGLAANFTSTLTYPVWSDIEVFCGEESLSVNVSGKWCLCTALSLLLW